MGPPSLNGGNCPAGAARTSASPSFNGAAVSQRRKPRRPGASIGGTCGFNGAAVSQRRKLSPPNRTASARECFNGAAVSQRRKLVAERAVRSESTVASMGPPSLNGGNRQEPAQVGALAEASMGPPSLNGGNIPGEAVDHEIVRASMGPPSLNGGNLTWRRGFCAPRRRFNGAAVSQRRKPAIRPRRAISRPPLQWGRRLSTAETVPAGGPHQTRRAAPYREHPSSQRVLEGTPGAVASDLPHFTCISGRERFPGAPASPHRSRTLTRFSCQGATSLNPLFTLPYVSSGLKAVGSRDCGSSSGRALGPVPDR